MSGSAWLADQVEPGQLAEQQAALRRVATLVASGAPSTELFPVVVREVAQVMHLPMVGLYRYDGDDMMTVLATWSDRPHLFQPGTRWPLDGYTMISEVYRTGRPARIEDYADTPGRIAAGARESGLNATAGAPIIVGGSVWGAMGMSSPDEPLPDQAEYRLAEFTELVATAIASGQARDELTRLADEQAALRRVATLVAAGAPPAEVFEAVSTEVATLIPADGSALTRYEADGTVTAIGGWTADGGYIYAGNRYPLEGTVSGLVLETGRPARIDAYSDAPGEAQQAARQMGWRSSVAAPITVDGRLWGALALASMSEQPLPRDAEVRLVEFTELVATAIANSQAHEELAQVAQEQAALRRVATLAARGAPLAEVVAAVSVEVARLVDADGAGVTRYADDGTFAALGGWSRSGPYDFTGISFDLEGSMSGVVFETLHPSRIDTFEGRPGKAAAAMRERGWCSAAGAPIAVEDRLWGALIVYSKRAEPLPLDTEARLAKFTEIVATAIANSQAHEELAQVAQEQAALRRVATLAAKGAAPSEVAAAVGAEVGRLLGAEGAGVTRYDDDGMFTVLGGWASDGGETFTGRRFAYEGSMSGLVLETGGASRIDSFDSRLGEAPAQVRVLGWQSAAGVPILVGGRPWGVLMVYSKRVTPFPRDTESRLAEFTQIVATAIANAESREKITRLADEQAALRRVATLVAQGVPPTEIFSAVSDELGRLFGAPQAAIGRFEPDGTALVVVGASAGIEGVSIGTRWPLEPFLASAAVHRTGRTARKDEDDWEDASGPVADELRRIGFPSTVAAPIVVDGNLWGVMTVSDKRDRLPPDTEARVENFTDLIATAIANADSRGELEASRARIVSTADATRRRIERDLHDGAQQRLLSLALEVRAAEAAAPAELTAHRAELSHIAEGLTNVLDGLREIALGLHPAILAEGGLKAALKTLAQRSPIPVTLDVQVDMPLPEHVEVAVYYVVSEALTNAAKYSRASNVDVDVTVRGDVLCVKVADDGIGGADPARGSGLLGLKDRAAAIGGTIRLASHTGEGTTLTAELVLGGGLRQTHDAARGLHGGSTD